MKKPYGRCPICHSRQKELFFKTPQRSLYTCLRCQLIYVLPWPKKSTIQQLYQDEYFQLGKDKKKILGYRDYKKQERFLIPYFRKKLGLIDKLMGGKKGKLLDIGCALGHFLELAKKESWEVTGLDISDYSIREVRKKGIMAVKGPLVQARLKSSSFGVVTLFQTLEHDYDPLGLLDEIKRILKPGGLLVLTVPDQKNILARILGKKWHGWQTEGHLIWFDSQNLEFALKKAGFSKIKVEKDLPIWGSLEDSFEALNMHYTNRVTKGIFVMIDWLPKKIKEAAIVPQTLIRGLSANVIK